MEYSRENPFFARMTVREPLCKEGSLKNTQHIVLDLKGSGLRYEAGDCVAVCPDNDPILVEKTLLALKASGCEQVVDKRSGERYSLKDYLAKKGDLCGFGKKFLEEVAKRGADSMLMDLLEDRLQFKAYQSSRMVWEVLESCPDARFSPQEFCDLLKPLMPRFYSIASSMREVGEEVHLTVGLIQYVNENQRRLGVCTNYLCNRAPIGEPAIPLYIHRHSGFTVPSNPETPMIMVGPGTGVAPFRSFMQERDKTGASGRHWLFFGEWKRDQNYFYQDYWTDLESRGKLRVDLAFSRDQADKIYVQHRMLERGEELFRWLEEGAYFYVCGDATRMAKDVDAALHEIVRQWGRCDEGRAKEYVKALRQAKRYLRDVY